MTEQQTSAIIIPFPKRHRGVNPVLPAQAIIVPPTATKANSARTATAKPTGSRPLTVEPAITGLPTLRSPIGKVSATDVTTTPLSRVISDLDAALTQQNAAVARWRNAIQDLRNAIDGLDGSLRQYRDRMTPSNKGVSAS